MNLLPLLPALWAIGGIAFSTAGCRPNGKHDPAADAPRWQPERIYGDPDLRAIEKEPQLLDEASGLVSFVDTSLIRQDGSVMSRTLDMEIHRRCSRMSACRDYKPSIRLRKLSQSMVDFPTAPECAGVLLEPNVVAGTKHCLDSIGSARAVFGLDATPQPFVRKFTSKCSLTRDMNDTTPRPVHDLVLLVLDGAVPEKVATPTPVQDLSGREWAMAIGHPLGLFETVSGANAETKIGRCGKDGKFHATIDSFQRSSGSPVFVSSSHEPSGHWTLFGLLQTSDNVLVCRKSRRPRRPGTCDYQQQSLPEDLCDSSTIVVPLRIAVDPAKQIAKGQVPAGWDCEPSLSWTSRGR